MIQAGKGRAKPTLILGTTRFARELAELIVQQPKCPYRLLGLVRDTGHVDARLFPCPILGSIDELRRIVMEYMPEFIIVAVAERRRHLPVRKLVEARLFYGVAVINGEDVYERLTGKLAIDTLTPSSVIFSRAFRPPRAARLFARLTSITVAALGLLILAPLYGIIALAIYWESGSPVLFVQERTGLAGRRFRMLKFRTMRPAQQRVSEWARDNGHRITRVGKWLRRFRLDELPQFINILRGDMNLVGPRPHPASNYGLFSVVSRNLPECGEPIPYYALRSFVRPGLTGWAQVRYRYANDLDEEMEKLRYDLYYIKHYSVRMDLYILFATIQIVLGGREQPQEDKDRVAGVVSPQSAQAVGPMSMDAAHRASLAPLPSAPHAAEAVNIREASSR